MKATKIKTTKTTRKRIVAQHKFVSVVVSLTDGKITAINLAPQTGTGTEAWKYLINSAAQLKAIHTVTGEMLAELRRRGLLDEDE